MKKILIVGIGGVGGYYGGMLSRHFENDQQTNIYFLARGAHLEKIQKDGLTIQAETETFVTHPTLATNQAAEIGEVDIAIITPKSYDLESTIDQIRPCIGQNTIILPLLNGVNISERIRQMLPGNEVWEGCVYIVGRIIVPGIIRSNGGVHDLYFGNAGGQSPTLNEMNQIMLAAGIKAHLCSDIRMIIWRKFIFISVTATLTSYYNVGFRDLLTTDERKAMTLKLLHEIAALAAAEGVVFEHDIIETTIKHIERLQFETTSSMNSDFRAGNRTELETLTGIVVELGIKLEIETPAYRKVYSELVLRQR